MWRGPEGGATGPLTASVCAFSGDAVSFPTPSSTRHPTHLRPAVGPRTPILRVKMDREHPAGLGSCSYPTRYNLWCIRHGREWVRFTKGSLPLAGKLYLCTRSPPSQVSIGVAHAGQTPYNTLALTKAAAALGCCVPLPPPAGSTGPVWRSMASQNAHGAKQMC